MINSSKAFYYYSSNSPITNVVFLNFKSTNTRKIYIIIIIIDLSMFFSS